MWLLSSVVVALVAAGSVSPVIVDTLSGRLRGTTLQSSAGHVFFAFKAIRFAKAPLGPLRFKPPEPPNPWTDILDATEDPPACPQDIPSEDLSTSEDCLYLNIYTRQVNTSDRPVVIYFHHGAFMYGTARSDFFDPQYLLDRDLVLVVPQSRLGPLGYLSTGDSEAVGNYGMKDQVMAMRWVKENIASFGGDPARITIAGYGTGSTSVLLHLLSPMSNGLFARGIAMSGPLLADWVVRKDAQKLTEDLAEAVNCTQESSRELVSCLRSIPYQQLVKVYPALSTKVTDAMALFGPVIEPTYEGGGETFISDFPVDIIKSGNFTQVPLIIGNTRDEFMGQQNLIDSTNLEYDKLEELQNQSEILMDLFTIYLGNETLKNETYGTTKFLSDRVLIYPQQQSAKLLSNFSSSPIFFYMTSFAGRYSFLPDKKNLNKPEIGHTDDLLYLFHIPEIAPPYNWADPERFAVSTYTSIWYNFAATGDPTPETADAGVKWLPMTLDDLKHLEIGHGVKMEPGLPHPERMELLAYIYSLGLTI